MWSWFPDMVHHICIHKRFPSDLLCLDLVLVSQFFHMLEGNHAITPTFLWTFTASMFRRGTLITGYILRSACAAHICSQFHPVLAIVPLMVWHKIDPLLVNELQRPFLPFAIEAACIFMCLRHTRK